MKRQSKRKLAIAALVGLPASFFGQSAKAATTYTFTNGNTDSIWPETGNWNTPGYPGLASTDIASFSSAGAGNVSLSGSNLTITTLSFANNAAAFNIGVTAGDTLTFAPGGTITYANNGSSAQMISAAVVSTGSGLTITDSNSITSTASLVFSGLSTGTGAVNLTGTGPVAVGASSGVNGGPLGTGTVFFETNTNIQMQAYGSQTISNPIIATTSFVIQPNPVSPGSLTWTGPVTFDLGQNRSFGINTGTNAAFTIGSPGSTNTVTLTNTNGSSDAIQLAINGGSTLVVNSPIVDGSNTADSIKYVTYNQTTLNTNSAAIVQLNGASTYSGGTNGTILDATSAGANNGTATYSFEIGVNSTFSGSAVTSGAFGTGAIFPAASTSVTPVTFQPHGADRTIGNTVNLTNGGFIVSNDSSGSYNMTFAGPITLGTASGKVINNNLNTGEVLTFGLPGTSASTFTLGSGATTFQTNSTNSAGTVINDVIQNGTSTTGSLIIKNQTAGGPVYLNGNSTYIGGTLVQGTGTSAAAVGTGGTLAGTGYVGSNSGTVVISGTSSGSYGGKVSPGSAPNTAGTLYMPFVQLNPYGQYIFEHSGTTTTIGSGVNDLISAVGTLDLSNLSSTNQFDIHLVPLSSGDGVTPQTFTLGTFGSGIFSSGVQDTSGTDLSSDFSISGETTTAKVFVDNSNPDNLDITFIPIATPEPSSLLLLAAGIGALNMRRRRKAKPPTGLQNG